MQTSTPNPTGSILALDVGERRIGVAVATWQARLPRPLTTLEHTPDIAQRLQTLISEQQVTTLVLGLPRGLDGQHTGQTAYAEQFGESLKPLLTIPINWQDEAVTSRQAEAELIGRGKPYAKGDIDALSATYILEDFLRQQSPGGRS